MVESCQPTKWNGLRNAITQFSLLHNNEVLIRLRLVVVQWNAAMNFAHTLFGEIKQFTFYGPIENPFERLITPENPIRKYSLVCFYDSMPNLTYLQNKKKIYKINNECQLYRHIE